MEGKPAKQEPKVKPKTPPQEEPKAKPKPALGRDVSHQIKELRKKIETSKGAIGPHNQGKPESKAEILNETLELRSKCIDLGHKPSIPPKSSLKRVGVDKIRLYRREIKKQLELYDGVEKVSKQAQDSHRRKQVRQGLEEGKDLEQIKQQMTTTPNTVSQAGTTKCLDEARVNRLTRMLTSLNIIACNTIEKTSVSYLDTLDSKALEKSVVPRLDGWTKGLLEERQMLEDCWKEIYLDDPETIEALASPWVNLSAILASSAFEADYKNRLKNGLSEPYPTVFNPQRPKES